MTFRSLATLQGGTSADTGDTPGEPAGTRFVGFGESLTSAISNRPHYALGENTDDLNTRLAPWEAGGLDTAYDLGAAAVPGGGRQITKDAGAVESVSALATYYADDVANAHFRADATGDTLAQGGGYDFKGSIDPEGVIDGSGWAGYLDRRLLGIRPAGLGSYFGGTESVDLNPGGAASSTIQLNTGGRKFFTIAAGPSPSAGNYTDINLRADLVEITGSASSDGLYLMWALGSAETDILLRDFDGGTPVFGTADETVTATFYRVKFGSFGTNFPTSRGFLNANAMVADQFGPALSLLASGDEGTLASADLLRSYYREADGTVSEGVVSIDRFGRIRATLGSGSLPESYSVLGTEFSRRDGGAFVSRVDRDGAGAEISHYVTSDNNDTEGRYDFLSLTPLEISGTGIDLSIPFDFVAETVTEGRLEATAGAGLASFWQSYPVNSGLTIVEILTGSNASLGFYVLSFHNTTGNGYVYIHNLDHTLPTHLPTSGAGTLRIYTYNRIGRSPSTSLFPAGLGDQLEAFPGQNTTMTAYATFGGGYEQDAASLVVSSPGNEDASDDRALIRAFVTARSVGIAPLEVFGVYPGDINQGGSELGRVRVTNLISQGGDIRINGGDYLYCASTGAAALRTRTVYIGLGDYIGAFEGVNDKFELETGTGTSQYNLTSLQNDGWGYIDINKYLRTGMDITGLRFRWNLGSQHATVGDRVRCILAYTTVSMAMVFTPTPTILGDEDDGGVVAGWATIDVGATIGGGSHIVDLNGRNYYVAFQASSDGSAPEDELHAIELVYGDPGPRNY